MSQYFNTQLRKALTSTDAAALLPYDLVPTLEEELLRLSPLAALLGVIPAGGKTHEYSIRTSHPQAWFEGEATPANATKSAYARKSVMLKIQRIWGSVTGFAQTVTDPFIDAFAAELQGSVEGMADIFEYGALWGCADDIGFKGDAYQYSGILPRLFSYAPANVIDAGGDKITLADLDSAFNKISGWRGVSADPKLWLMSQGMKSVVDGLQTKVSMPLTSVTLQDGKFVMAAYGGHPIYEHAGLTDTAGTSPACTAVAASGGSIPDGTWTYQIAMVTINGECVPGTASSNVVAGSGNNKANLTWTHSDDALAYLIFRKKSTDSTYSLLDIIAALSYDAAGTVTGNVESYSDDGSKTVKAIKPLAAGEQNIALINMNPNRGCTYLGRVDDMGQQIDRMISFVDLARTKDSYDYMLKSYLAFRIKYPNLNALVRHCKLS